MIQYERPEPKLTNVKYACLYWRMFKMQIFVSCSEHRKKTDTNNKNRQCPRISWSTNKIRMIKLGLTTLKIKDFIGLGKLDNWCRKNRETRNANTGIWRSYGFLDQECGIFRCKHLLVFQETLVSTHQTPVRHAPKRY